MTQNQTDECECKEQSNYLFIFFSFVSRHFSCFRAWAGAFFYFESNIRKMYYFFEPLWLLRNTHRIEEKNYDYERNFICISTKPITRSCVCYLKNLFYYHFNIFFFIFSPSRYNIWNRWNLYSSTETKWCRRRRTHKYEIIIHFEISNLRLKKYTVSWYLICLIFRRFSNLYQVLIVCFLSILYRFSYAFIMIKHCFGVVRSCKFYHFYKFFMYSTAP